MTLRIAYSRDEAVARRHMDFASQRVATSMQRLSTGLRINTSADDASGLGISESLRAQVRGLEQASRNMQDGIALLQTAEGALSAVHSILHRSRDLAVQWNSGTLTTADKTALQVELQALSDELDGIERTTQYNGIALLQSNTATVTLQVGSGATDQLAITLEDLVGQLVGVAEFQPALNATADVAAIDADIEAVMQARSTFGATCNRLEHSLATTSVRQEQLMQTESRVRDTDMAYEMTNLTKHQIMQQSATMNMLFQSYSKRRVLDLIAPGLSETVHGTG